ncbi:hypothetical protein [Viridibacillus arvi]|uniref:hypothetical protein n=1 Tax=Viridibacillus arvi TaxID=263475 RepID=UPI0034CD56E5
MKIKYIYRHGKDRDYQDKIFAIEEIENGKAKEYTYFMKCDGYILVNRQVEL